MSQLPYDITSAKSIQEYSRRLIGKSLEETVGKYNLDHLSNKGKLGLMVEEHFFQYSPGPNRDHEPDFAEAGVELKVTGVISRSKHSSNESPFKAKERLVLTMINYYGLADEAWDSSSFLKKCSLMLILFYLYNKDVPATQRKFVLSPVLWTFPEVDLEIIRKDWDTIQQKVLDGNAHELSEGDTFYLAACRKGAGGTKERPRAQPFSSIPAKSRAFSLKPSYVNAIINSTWNEESLIHSETDAHIGIEEITLRKFQDLKNKTVNEIATMYDYFPGQKQAKNYLADLSLRILGTTKKWLPEFQKASIVLKTIRLQKNGTPKEAISFPTLDFIETSEQQWEDSTFFEKIEQKFLFVIYQYDANDVLRFKKVMFWNMPYQDRLEAQGVWQLTVDVIKSGQMNELPKTSQSSVAHVRPHGRNKEDTLPLPNGGTFTKQCFWLNQLYIASQIK
jgi:DNA mismatch repair protein MutH